MPRTKQYLEANYGSIGEDVCDKVYEVLEDKSLWKPPTVREITEMVPYSQSAVHKATIKMRERGQIDDDWRPTGKPKESQ